MRKALNLFAIFCSLAAYSQTTLAEHHFESSEVDRVVIEGVFCDVYATGGANKVIFDGVITGDGDRGDYVIASIQNGSTVIFQVEKKNSGKNWGWNSIKTSKLTLNIPDNVTLSINNTSGDIEITDLKATELEVQATSGDVALKNVNADCQIRTTSGDLLVREVKGNVRMSSTSGDQEYYGIDGDLSATATSGEMEITQLRGFGKLSTTSGDIELDGVVGVIQAQATSGEIEGEFISLTGNSRFKTTSGDIEIRLENPLDELSFDLDATSGDLRVGGISAEDNLVIEKGPINIKGISTSGSQVFTD